jgi:hypothetical protein
MIRYRNRSFHTGIIHHHDGYLLLFYGDRYLEILKREREREGPEGENVEPTTNLTDVACVLSGRPMAIKGLAQSAHTLFGPLSGLFLRV